MIVALSKAGFVVEKCLEFEFFEEEKKQIDAAKVGKVLPGEGPLQIFGA